MGNFPLTVHARGAVWRRTVDQVSGDPGMPMTPDAVLAKFHAYAAPVIGDRRARAIAQAVMDGNLSNPLMLAPL